MTAPLVLVGLVLVLVSAGPRFLVKAPWAVRSPALGILAWQALTASVFGSLVLAGLSLAVPEIPASQGLADFFHACTAALRDHYATPGGAALALAGGAVATTLIARFAVVLARDLLAVRRDRARQHDLLSLVSQPHGEPNVVVVEHESAAVYCLPGRRRQIVVTRAAIDALSAEELGQVLAHERAHIQARHHLALLFAGALATCFRGQLGFGTAREHSAGAHRAPSVTRGPGFGASEELCDRRPRGCGRAAGAHRVRACAERVADGLLPGLAGVGRVQVSTMWHSTNS